MAAFFRHKKLKSEKTLGEYLKSLRIHQGYSLEQVEEATRVNIKYLSALESDNFDALPVEIYTLGFLGRYADFLQVDKNKLIASYKQENNLYSNLKHNRPKENGKADLIKPNPSEKWLKPPSFVLTPKLIISSLIILLVLGIMGYIWYQVKSFAAAPPLEISGSVSNVVVKVSSLTIEGQTDSGANLAINNQSVALDSNGRFSQEIKLNPGMNTIEIIAKNKIGKVTQRELKILAEF